MNPRFPPPPWLRSPPHRTLRQVDLTEAIRDRIARGKPYVLDARTLAELEARAVEPERDTEGAA